jgi:hypothetical protein
LFWVSLVSCDVLYGPGYEVSVFGVGTYQNRPIFQFDERVRAFKGLQNQRLTSIGTKGHVAPPLHSNPLHPKDVTDLKIEKAQRTDQTDLREVPTPLRGDVSNEDKREKSSSPLIFKDISR